ncbi:MAG: 30S ribosomal protein S6 [Anaerolineales bacterium]
MRDYEVAFIAQPDLDEASLNALIEKAKGWITGSGGQVAKVDVWGRRRMAYAIRKQTEGQYVIIFANLPPAATREIERNMRFTEQVLRFLVVRAEE